MRIDKLKVEWAERRMNVFKDYTYTNMSVGEIAKKYGVTKARVFQIIHRVELTLPQKPV